MKRSTILALLALTACATVPPPIPPRSLDLVDELNALAEQAEAQGTLISAYVVDAKTGEPLYAHHEHARSNPASTMKLATTTAALTTFGPEYTFHTPLMLVGKQTKDLFEGDLVVTASGDPSFGSRAFFSTEILPRRIAQALLARGIKRWKGGVRVVGGETAPQNVLGPGWAWDDIENDFSASPLPFVFHDNVAQLIVNRPGGTHTPAPQCGDLRFRLEPPINRPHVDVQVKAAETNEGLSCVRDLTSIDVHCLWPLPPDHCGQHSATWLSVADPRALFEASIVEAGYDFGITHLSGEARITNAAPELLLDVQSPPMRELVRVTNKESLNLYAERLAMAVTKVQTGIEGYEALQKTLAADQATRGIDPRDLFQVDGSGLSRYNLVTSFAMVQLLRTSFGTPYEEALIASLPISGLDGTLRRHLLEQPARVWAKTGTLTGQRGFVGFIVRPWDERHPTLAFALLIGNAIDSRKDTNALFDRFVELAALAPLMPQAR